MNNWGTHQLLQGLENISLYSDKIPKSKIALWLYDKEKPYQVSNSRKVDYDYFSYFQDRYKIPIPFVDTFYVYNYLFQERKNLKDNRNVNVFFAGNFNKEYENTVLNDKFGIPNRVETFLFLKKNFNLEIPETTATELMGKEGAIYIFDRNLRNVPPEELVKFLNNSKFFIAFPGVVMPFCHNVIEAMAMGCIPILNYSKLFTPNLVAYENCLTYSSLQDLKDLILQIPEMDVQMISQMRKNVIAYYDKYLSITAVVDQVLDPIYNRISICAEHQSIELIKS